MPRRPPTFSRAIVVGASSGIGASLARQLADGGARVVALARRGDELDKLAAGRDGALVPVVHDVRATGEVPDLFSRACAALGGLDLIIYAAGAMPPADPARYDTDADRTAVEVNLLGAMAWLNEAAARFGEARAGTIVGIGSMAGERGRRANPAYGAAKAGLHTYLESLRNRLATRGVSVVTVKPGFVDTAMTRGLPGLFWLVSADEAARQILAAASRGSVTAFVPARWRWVSLAVRAIPSPLFRRLPI